MHWRTIASAFKPATLLTGGTTLVIEPDVGRTATTRDCLHRRKAVGYRLFRSEVPKSRRASEGGMGITCVEEFIVTRANLSASVLPLIPM